MKPEVKKILEKKHYKVVGNHSAVKLCHWTKKSILDQGYCYKQKFYGIKSHRCLQMSPAVVYCTQKCLFCWRDTKLTFPEFPIEETDDPKEIIEGCIKAQRQLLSGYGGIPDRINKKKFEEAQKPNQVAISLAGEPTLYPKLSQLIEEFHNYGFTTFLVTNATLPERIADLDEMPTQLYYSLDAPSEEIYKKLCNPLLRDAWKRINESLELMPSLDTRKVIRITLVKGFNMIEPESYAKLILKAEPDFIEVKAYMFLGDSRARLSLANMPSFSEVMDFAKELDSYLSYGIRSYKEDSRVVLLSKRKNTKIKQIKCD